MNESKKERNKKEFKDEEMLNILILILNKNTLNIVGQ